MLRANYVIVESESSDDVLVIRDVGPWTRYATVTNDAETVVGLLYATGLLSEERRLLYYDSDGRQDEIRHGNGVFLGFRAGWGSF